MGGKHFKQLSILTTIATICSMTIISSSNATAKTTLPVPRFVTTKSDESNARTGPSTRSPIRWVYTQQGHPLEITAEFKQWRRVKDINGDGGWMHQSLLSGRRNGLIKGETPTKIYRDDDIESRVIAHIEPLTLVRLDECEKDWCEISASGHSGWIEKKYIWGVYVDEVVD